MVMALQSLNSGTANASSGQLGLYRSKLQQAKREADQAENRVAQLEQQTQTARNQASRANDRVRAAESNPPPTGLRAGNAPSEAPRATLNTLGQLNGRLLNVQA
jgi:chromosome segregation ATPase